MKRLLAGIYAIFLLTLPLSVAQAQITFTIEDNIVNGGGVATSLADLNNKTHAKNTSSSTSNFRWIIINRTLAHRNWQSAICDKNTCYLPTTDTAEFDLSPGEKGLMAGHFYPYGIAGKGSMTVILFAIDDAGNINSDIDTIVYNLEGWPEGSLPMDSNMITTSNTPDQNEIQLETVISNTSDTSLSYEWKLLSTNMPSGWELSICDPTCSDSSKFTMNPNDTRTLQAKFKPNGNKGEGIAKVLVYLSDYAYSGDTVTFLARAWPTSINDVKNIDDKIHIYPNPVNDFINIHLPAPGIESVEIFNILGKKVISIIPNGENLILNVEKLQKGIYFTRFSAGKNISTRSFIKR